jgi:hypothetical protein
MNFEMPKPGEAQKPLERFVGTWTGDERMHPGPMGPGGTAKGTSVCRMTGDGFFLITDYEQECNGQIMFRGHGVMGFDHFSKRYLWYWVDSMGMPPGAATFGDVKGDGLVFESDTPHGRMRYSYAFEGRDRYRFKIETSPDQGKTWTAFMEGDYRRTK